MNKVLKLKKTGAKVLSWKEAFESGVLKGLVSKVSSEVQGSVFVFDELSEYSEFETVIPKGVNFMNLFLFKKSLLKFELIEKISFSKDGIYGSIWVFEEGVKGTIVRVFEGSEDLEINHKVTALKGAEVSQTNLWFNGLKIKAEIVNRLKGEESQINQNDLLLINKNQEAEIKLDVLHEGENTSSKSLIKNVIKDSAKQTFNGMVKILKSGQKSNGYLETNSMLLSENASCNNNPSLEIEADDVKASHAATTEHIDEDSLFYLQSRGVSKELGKELVIKSFLESIISNYSEKLQDFIKEKINEKWDENGREFYFK